MKNLTLIFLFILTLSGKVEAQFFNNTNSELCLKLYDRQNGQDRYTVYMVMENLDSTDVAIINRWNTLDEKQKHAQTVNWSDDGKRVEVENGDLIMNPPIFPKNWKKPNLQPRPQPKDQRDPWEKAGESPLKTK